MQSLESLIDTVKHNLDKITNSYPNETSVREQIVLPILGLLDWKTIDPSSVRLEYQVKNYKSESRKVDYALFAKKQFDRPTLIIEVKAVGKVDADDQLFEYAFITGVELAILTDGREWRIYLPISAGSYQERLIRTIDFSSSGAEDSANALRQFLSYENVASGKSVEMAKNLANQKKQSELAKSKIDDAWVNLTAGPNAKIVELLIEETSRISGYAPNRQDAINFLAQIPSTGQQSQSVKSTTERSRKTDGLPQTSYRDNSIDNSSQNEAKPKGRTTTFWLFNHEYNAKNYTRAYVMLMEILAPEIPENQLEQLSFFYRSKEEMANNYYRKSALPVRHGSWWTHTHLSSDNKFRNVKKVCDAASIRFGDRSGLIFPGPPKKPG